MSRPHRIPVLSLGLIALNMAAAFGVILAPDLVNLYGFRPASPTVLTALLSLFLHANTLHLLGNMVYLAAVGPAVEFAAGAWRLLLVYSVGGLLGVGLHTLLAGGDRLAPLVGASGAIAACAAYSAVRYFRLKVPLAPNVAVPMIAITGFWLLLQVAGAFVSLDLVGGTAYWSHLGGFAAGLGMAAVFRVPQAESLSFGHEVLDRMNARGPGATLAAAEDHLRRHPHDPKAHRERCAALALLGEPDREAQALLEWLQAAPEAQIHEPVARLCAIDRAEIVPSLRRNVLADRLQHQHPDVARALLESVIHGPAEDPERPAALLALADLERDHNPEQARSLMQTLAQGYPLSPILDIARGRGWDV